MSKDKFKLILYRLHILDITKQLDLKGRNCQGVSYCLSPIIHRNFIRKINRFQGDVCRSQQGERRRHYLYFYSLAITYFVTKATCLTQEFVKACVWQQVTMQQSVFTCAISDQNSNCRCTGKPQRKQSFIEHAAKSDSLYTPFHILTNRVFMNCYMRLLTIKAEMYTPTFSFIMYFYVFLLVFMFVI